jgi:hypothetical protein
MLILRAWSLCDLRIVGIERIAGRSSSLLEEMLLVQKEAFERIHQIVDQVPAIRHLHSLWRSAAGPVGIEAAAVATHDLDTWVGC